MEFIQTGSNPALTHLSAHLGQTLDSPGSLLAGNAIDYRSEGILALLVHRTELAKAARAEFARNCMLHAAHERAIAPIVQSFAKPMLVIKGAHLAKGLYGSAGWRTRTDTDVWIDRRDVAHLHEVLINAGWQASNSQFGDLELPERCYRIQALAHTVSLDVHWGLSARPAIARVFSFAEVFARASRGAFAGMHGPNDIDALLIAAQHLLGHHRHERRAIWLADIWLLWQRLNPTERDQCVRQASDMRVASLMLAALQYSFGLMEETLPPDLIQTFEHAKRTEPLAGLLDDSQSSWRIDWISSNWHERFTQLRERILARPEFLRARFNAPKAPIVLLHMRRWFVRLKRFIGSNH
jgi:hypothetical protein